MTDEQDPPIACTLTGTDYEERLAWIAQLNHDGLRTHRRDGPALHLQYDAAVRDRVHELVRRESACCAFLAFAVAETAGGIVVTITVPDRAKDDADQLLSPFVPAGPGNRVASRVLPMTSR